MRVEQNLLSDDWKRNWQQSIAVRISALALWVILPISLGITFYYISGLEQQLSNRYIEKADVIAHRIQNYFDNNPFANNHDLAATAKKLMQDLGFSSIKIVGENSEWYFGQNLPDSQWTSRQIKIAPLIPDEPSTIKIIAQHPEIDVLVKDKRNQILFAVILGLVSLGIFLILSIRTMVHHPLEKLVAATQAVSDGIMDLRLDPNRQDEFGYIARFFNEMLDQLLEQQEKLKDAAEDARSANNAKSAFLANMSHELRTPLNAIIGYSDLLVDQATELEQLEYIPDLEKISTAGKYLLDLISNILDITKIETGKTEIYYEDIDLSKMINDVTSTMAPLVAKKHNELNVVIETDINGFKSDYTKLRQSLFNLLSNACKFTENGMISLRVYSEKFNVRRKLIFEISDTGTGMSPNCMNNLFIPFSRGRNSNALKISGTGLGLAISRHFCNLLCGEISVESNTGVGTTFRIHLPYIKADADTQAIPRTSSGTA